MRRWIGLVLLIAGLTLAHAVGAGQAPPGFSFVLFADARQTSDTGGTIQRLASSIASASPRPAFVIGGGLTLAGRPEEYRRVEDAAGTFSQAGAKLWAVPGSHDIRWCPEGKEPFARLFGKAYQSFDHGGMHFVLLDSTVYLEHWGHLDKTEIDWLAKDVRRLKPDQPVVLVLSHGLGRGAPASRVLDNEYDLIPPLRGHNLVAIFTCQPDSPDPHSRLSPLGRGDTDAIVGRFAGASTFAAPSLSTGAYLRIDVTGETLAVNRVDAKGSARVASVPIPRSARISVMRAGWDDPDIPYLARRRPAALLEPRAVNDNPDKERAEYRLDAEPWKPMTRDPRDVWRDVFQTKGMTIGIHSADVRLTTSNNVTFEDELIFEVERDVDEPNRKWALNLDGPIQSSPVVDGGLVYVACGDGKVYALEAAKGKRKWSFPTKGALVATPTLDGNTLFAGSTDHGLYALESATGKLRWRYDAGSPIFGPASIAQGVVCVGVDGKIVGIDARSGQGAWETPAGGWFQSRAATDGDTFYLTGWDHMVYALDAKSGAVRWKVAIDGGLPDLGSSPAVASPAFANGRVYAVTLDGKLHALHAANGMEDWAIRAPAGADPFGYSSPTVGTTELYVAGIGEHGDVYAVDLATGAIRWRATTGQPIYDSSPHLAPDGRSLAIMAVRGSVSVLDTETGRRLWGYELGPGNIFSNPDYDGSVVYTTTMANDVQALNAPGVATSPAHPKRTAQ